MNDKPKYILEIQNKFISYNKPSQAIFYPPDISTTNKALTSNYTRIQSKQHQYVKSNSNSSQE